MGCRLECSDVTHNCFAGITGCRIATADPNIVAGVTVGSKPLSTLSSTGTIAAGPEGGSTAPSHLPSVSGQAFLLGVQSSQPPTGAPVRSPVIVPSSTEAPPLFSTEVISVQSAEPTLLGDTVAAPSRSPAASNHALVVQSAEPTLAGDGGGGYQNPSGNTYYCGRTYDEIFGRCFASKPCPGGTGSDYCADHEGCFLVPGCTAQYKSAVIGASGTPPPTMPPNSSMQQQSMQPDDAPSSRVRRCLIFFKREVSVLFIRV